MKTIISILTRFVPRRYLQRISHIVLRMISVFYVGNNRECPVCGRKYRKFLPYGRVIKRENALCPGCLSLERHRIMWLFLRDHTDFFTAGLKVLHIAPEYCFIKRFKALENLDYITGDLESPLADVKLDIRDIPFEDNTFNTIICNHTLEHVDDDLKAMKEFYRVLRPGGWAVLNSPINEKRKTTYEDFSITDPAEREKHFGQRDHVREYGLDYTDRLAEAGFTIHTTDILEDLSPEQVDRYGLLHYGKKTAEELVYLVNKE
ncbi:MAG: methyltransferase domain-containing protein [Bacteroidales bacterium]|nr:methyltransferase domain-containing protein [Bacteroidales bacterium]